MPFVPTAIVWFQFSPNLVTTFLHLLKSVTHVPHGLYLELEFTLGRGWCVVLIWHNGTCIIGYWYKNILRSLVFHSNLGLSPRLTLFRLLTLERGWGVVLIWHDGTCKIGWWYKNIPMLLVFHLDLGLSPCLTLFRLFTLGWVVCYFDMTWWYLQNWFVA